jgi:hypothetical protein
MPPVASYHCRYASMWVGSKYKWKLTITDAEKAALGKALSTC